MDMDDQLERWLADKVPPELLSTALPDDIAREVIARLKKEFERYWYIDPNRSFEYAERIIAIGRARNDASQIAPGLMAKSDCLTSLGKMEEAWNLYDQAGIMFQAVGDEVGWARTRVGRLYLGPRLNCIPLTLAEAEQARVIFTRYGERDRLVRLDWQTAFVYNSIGEQHQALKLFAAALAMAESLGEEGEPHIIPLYEDIGLTHNALGDFHRALTYYERARELAIARNQTLSIAHLEACIAEIAQAQGQYLKALTLLQKAVEKVSSESRFEAAAIKYHMVECYLALNRYAEARDLAQQVIGDFRTFHSDQELARTLLNLAESEAALGKFDAAQTALAEAETIFESLGAISWIATIRLWRGRMALRQGEARIAYQDAITAEDCFEADGQRAKKAAATLLRGQALFMLQQFDAAAVAGHTSLGIAQRHNIPSLHYACHLLLGQIAEAQQANIRAIRYYKAAAATIERVQRGLTITLRSGFLEDKGEALRALIALYLRSGDTAGALETLERAKSQIWLGYLINRDRLRWSREDDQSNALIAELNRLRAEHQWFYGIVHHPPKEGEFPTAVQQEQAMVEVATRERRMRAITDQLYLQSGGGQWDNQAPVFSLREIQQELEEETLLVEYYRDGNHVWAFTLDKRIVRTQRLAVTIGEIDHLMRISRNNFSAAQKMAPDSPALRVLTQQAKRILARFYALLVEPLGIEASNPRKLIVIPYGVLHALPFQLLYDGSRYLIERYEIVNLPAAGLVTHHGPKRAPGALVLAHSWDGRLPYTLPEAKFVHQLFGGQLSVEEDVRQSVLERPATQILHIAAHGEYRLDQPDLSYLQLADSQLYTDDVLQQDLSYELVTLSACETGLANVATDEELIGLGRGFLYAGAGALILSLWGVTDRSTTDLMQRMYRALSRGESKSAALRHAQTSFLAENSEMHPAFWGAFQLVGDASPLSN